MGHKNFVFIPKSREILCCILIHLEGYSSGNEARFSNIQMKHVSLMKRCKSGVTPPQAYCLQNLLGGEGKSEQDNLLGLGRNSQNVYLQLFLSSKERNAAISTPAPSFGFTCQMVSRHPFHLFMGGCHLWGIKHKAFK